MICVLIVIGVSNMNVFRSNLCRIANNYGVSLSFNRSLHVNCETLWFHHTLPLSAEPLRKKKRMDPQVLRERAEKKIKRIQRDIKRLEKVAKQFKPISELEPPKQAMRDSERIRVTPLLTEEERKEQMELKQLWAVHKRKEHIAEIRAMQKVVDAQEKALNALEEASIELYQAALQPDPNLIPFKMQGPVETPPLEGYDYPDGDYFETTKVYQPILPTDPKRLRQLGLHKKKLK